ncbi:hypothetical protein E2C01_019623 [Portunus trituberculatus]|uniref:Uncharacterized protein n=1 Tax=Portunus trituberculatus TaxID=210409 RepID=A0A5B7DZV6_PORTR|nr:hypothetical protein [Portunus trituberculatus]
MPTSYTSLTLHPNLSHHSLTTANISPRSSINVYAMGTTRHPTCRRWEGSGSRPAPPLHTPPLHAPPLRTPQPMRNRSQSS